MDLWQFLLLYVVGVCALLYFLTVLPGTRKNKKTRLMHDSIAVGDEIATAGGIIGTVTERDGDTIRVRIDEEANVTMKVIVYAVSSIVQKAPEK